MLTCWLADLQAAVTTFILMVVYGPRTSKSKAAVVSPLASHVPSPWVVGMTNQQGSLPPTYLPGVIVSPASSPWSVTICVLTPLRSLHRH